MTWTDLLRGDPLPWLLEDDNPAVRQRALRLLLDRATDDPEVNHARAMAMGTGPIAAMLAAQHPDGYWVKPGPGYSPKYRSTVWQLIFLDQLGADGNNERIRTACEYVLSHTQTSAGGFGISYADSKGIPPASAVVHCLNGNLLHALIGFGWLEDERVQQAIEWQAGSITGEDFGRYYKVGTSGPGFCCAANEKLPCAWGAVKAMLALARIPKPRRKLHVQRAIEAGTEFLLSRNPVVADYPVAWGNKKPSSSWFKLAFPIGYVTDVLQNLEALCQLGLAKDLRLQPAMDWLLSKQDKSGRWTNQYAYTGKMWVDIEEQGAPSKWVTLRACGVLKAANG